MVSDSNIDFEKAIDLSMKNFSYEELINMLDSNSITEKQFAILNLETIKSKEHAQNLCSNLTGQDGKIREAVAFKLSEFFKNQNFAKLLDSEKNFETMLNGLMDINGNVCRFILEIDNEKFNYYLANNIIFKINEIIEHIENLTDEDKKYVISKRNFQLYWALECVYKIHKLIPYPKIKNLLLTSATIDDYTIKEKVAKILSVYKHNDTKEIKNILEQEQNYYISRYLN